MISKLDKYFSYFLKELELTNKSINTITSYKTTINSFKAFLESYEKHITTSNIKKIDILAFLDYKNDMLEKQSELKNSSKQLYITHLKTFFTFINENFETEINIKEIFNFKIQNPKRTPKGIEEEDMVKVKNYLNTLNIDNFLDLRRSMILKILIFSGCRRGELQEITIDDFNLINDELYSISVIGKGSKERTLYIPKQQIQKELELYKQMGFKYIATSSGKKRLNGSQIYKLLNTIFKQLNLHCSGVHILRHTFAKNMINKGLNITMVKELMGHSSITTTSIYTNPSKNEIEKSYMSVSNS